MSPSIPEGIPLKIVTKDRNFIIAFPTKEEVDLWCEKISEVKAAL